MKTTKTYHADIYVAYSYPYHYETAVYVCQRYCDDHGFCVTVTKTEYIYTDGREDGVIVGIINYPRFPISPAKLRKHAMILARLLKRVLKQKRVSIEFPDKTIMIGDSR